MCEVMTTKKECISSLIAMLNTLWYVGFQLFFFLNYYFLKFDEFFFQDTYNNRLKKKYEDDLSTQQNIDPDLWLEARSSGGLMQPYYSIVSPTFN